MIEIFSPNELSELIAESNLEIENLIGEEVEFDIKQYYIKDNRLKLIDEAIIQISEYKAKFLTLVEEYPDFLPLSLQTPDFQMFFDDELNFLKDVKAQELKDNLTTEQWDDDYSMLVIYHSIALPFQLQMLYDFHNIAVEVQESMDLKYPAFSFSYNTIKRLTIKDDYPFEYLDYLRYVYSKIDQFILLFNKKVILLIAKYRNQSPILKLLFTTNNAFLSQQGTEKFGVIATIQSFDETKKFIKNDIDYYADYCQNYNEINSEIDSENEEENGQKISIEKLGCYDNSKFNWQRDRIELIRLIRYLERNLKIKQMEDCELRKFISEKFKIKGNDIYPSSLTDTFTKTKEEYKQNTFKFSNFVTINLKNIEKIILDILINST